MWIQERYFARRHVRQVLEWKNCNSSAFRTFSFDDSLNDIPAVGSVRTRLVVLARERDLREGLNRRVATVALSVRASLLCLITIRQRTERV